MLFDGKTIRSLQYYLFMLLRGLTTIFYPSASGLASFDDACLIGQEAELILAIRSDYRASIDFLGASQLIASNSPWLP